MVYLLYIYIHGHIEGVEIVQSIKILVVDDEAAIVEILSLYLKREGYNVYSSLNATKGLRLMEEVIPDVVLLDINLPDENGFDLARRFRELSSDGILIFVTGERTKSTIMEGFEIGCDDYITKPFDPPEVIARIKANIRRSNIGTKNKLELGDLTIDFSEKTVFKKGVKVDLFIKEKQLLFYLAQHPNQILSAEQLYDVIWGIDSDAELKTVQVYLSTLRKKIEDNPKDPQYIKTVRGFGYKFSTIN